MRNKIVVLFALLLFCSNAAYGQGFMGGGGGGGTTVTSQQSNPAANVPYDSAGETICTLSLTAGKYLLIGQGTATTSNASDNIYLYFNDGTSNVGGAIESFIGSASVPFTATVSGIYTAAGNVTLSFKAATASGGGTIYKLDPSGGTSIVSHLTAIRISN